MKSGNQAAWKMLVAACLLVASGQGIITNTAGQYIVAICAARGFSIGGFVSYLSFGAVSMLIAFPLVGKVMAKFPLRNILLLCSVVWCAIYMLFSQFTQLWMFYAGNFIIGLMAAIPAYVIGPVLVSNWFEEKKGLATGIVMSCGSIFGALFSVIIAGMIGAMDFQVTYIAMGALSLVMMLAASFMAVLHPAMVGMMPYGAKGEGKKEDGSAQSAAVLSGVPAKRAYRSTAFLLVFLIILLLTCAGAFAPQIPVLATSKGFEATTASVFSSIFMVGGLAGAYLWGFLNDRLKSKLTTILCLAAGALGIAVSVLLGNTMALFAAGVLCFGLAASGVSVQAPMMVSELFGQREYVAIFATVQMAMSLGGVIGGPVYGFAYDGLGSYDVVLLAMAVVLAVCALLVPAAYASGKRLMQECSAAAK